MARPIGVLISVFLALAATAIAEDSARELRDQALTDVRGIQAAAPVQQHVTNAIRSLELSATAFTDGNHISDAGVFDGLRSAISSCAEGAKAALQRSDRAMADRLKADADRLQRAARLLASTLVADLRARAFLIDRKSAMRRDKCLAEADRKLTAGDQGAGATDNSFRRWSYAWQDWDSAVNDWKDSWKKADKAGRFRVALLSVEDAPDPVDPLTQQSVLTLHYRVRLDGRDLGIQSEWTINTAGGQVVRVLTSRLDVARQRGREGQYTDVNATITWDLHDAAGAVVADGTYPYLATGAIVPPDGDDDEDDDEETRRIPDGNRLEGSLAGTVTVRRPVPPEWLQVSPTQSEITDEHRKVFSGVPADQVGTVDLASIHVRLDGVEVAASVTAGLVSFTPAANLPDGMHRYEADLANTAGQSAPLLVRDFRVVEAVGPIDPTQGGSVVVTDTSSLVFGVAIEFPPHVAPPGTTAIISIPSTVPALPEGLVATGAPVNIEANPNTFDETVVLTLPYSEADLGGLPEEGLTVMFFEPSLGEWQPALDFTVDTVGNVVLVRTTTLSIWILVKPPAKPPTLKVISGSGQTGLPGSMLLGPLRALAADGSGKPLAGVKVTIQSVLGGGSFADDPNGAVQNGPLDRLTGADGVVQMYYRLGPTAGEQRVQMSAKVTGTSLSVTFVVQAIAPPPPPPAWTLRVIDGDRQTGAPGSVLPKALRAMALDDKGKAIGGLSVTITADASGGLFADDPKAVFKSGPVQRLTGVDGSVQIYFQLGPTSVEQAVKMSASYAGTALTAAFTLNPAPPPPPPGPTLTAIGGNDQTGGPGGVLPLPLRAAAKDASGKAIPGLTVTIKSSVGDAKCSDAPAGPFAAGPVDRATGPDGVVQIYLQLGSANGQQLVNMTAQYAGTSLAAVFKATAASVGWTSVSPPGAMPTLNRREPFSGTPSGGASAVDLATVRVRLDGGDVTSQAIINSAQVSFTPKTDMPDGTHTYEAEFRNTAGEPAPLLVRTFHVVSAMGTVNPGQSGVVTVVDPSNSLYGVSIEVPAGAVDKGTIFTISAPNAVSGLPAELQGLGSPVSLEAFPPAPAPYPTPLTLRFPYNEADLGGASEEGISIAFHEGANWVFPDDLTVDVAANVIAVHSTSLSIWYKVIAQISPTLSTLEVIPPAIVIGGSGVVRAIPRKGSGALAGSGLRVVIVKSGPGTLGLVRDLGTGTYEADLTAPAAPGSAGFKAAVWGVTFAQKPTATYVAAPAASFTFLPIPASVAAGGTITTGVQARDRFGNVVQSYQGLVSFASSDPRATIDGQPLASLQVINGLRTFVLQFGTSGLQSIIAQDMADPSISGAAGTLVQPGPLTSLVVVSGDGQRADQGTLLPEPLVVRAKDLFGNPIPDVSVTVSVVSGGGQVQAGASPPSPGPITVQTGADGTAQARWVLGPDLGAQEVDMSVGAVVARFTATTLPPDTTAPTVTFDNPRAFAVLNSGTFLLQARFADDQSGVDPATAQVVLNGVVFTPPEVQADASGVQFNIVGLPDGVADVRVLIGDRSGNEGSSYVQFLVDSVPPEVTVTPADGATITDFPVTFEVQVADAGSALVDLPAQIYFNGVNVTDRFTPEVQYRIPLFDVYWAQVVKYTYTPSAAQFTDLLRASGNGTLVMRVSAQDRSGNVTQSQGSYPTDLGPGGGGDGGGGGAGIGPLIVLQDARPSGGHPPATNRCISDFVRVRAANLTNGGAVVPGLTLSFESPQDWGFFVETYDGSSTTSIYGYATMHFVAGPTAGEYPLKISVPGDSSIQPLELTESATEPTFLPVADNPHQAEPGSCVLGGIDVAVQTGPDMRPGYGYPLAGELVRIVMVDDSGQETPIDESKFLVMPAETLTGPVGSAQAGAAHFEMIVMPGTPPGRYNFKARLVEWEDGIVFPITVLNPRENVISVPTPPDALRTNRNIYLSVVSGNAQIGAHDATLQRQLVVQLMQDGLPTGPISESYPLNNVGIQPPPTYEFHVRKVGFTVVRDPAVPPNALLSSASNGPSAGLLVDVDASGRASVTVTCGPTTGPIEITAVVYVETGPYEYSPDPSPLPGAVFAVGTPEVTVVVAQTSNGTTTYLPVSKVIPSTVNQVANGPQYWIEKKVPIGAPVPTDVNVVPLDACDTPLDSLSDSMVAPVRVDGLPMTAAPADDLRGDPARYTLYLSSKPITFLLQARNTDPIILLPPEQPLGPNYYGDSSFEATGGVDLTNVASAPRQNETPPLPDTHQFIASVPYGHVFVQGSGTKVGQGTLFLGHNSTEAPQPAANSLDHWGVDVPTAHRGVLVVTCDATSAAGGPVVRESGPTGVHTPLNHAGFVAVVLFGDPTLAPERHPSWADTQNFSNQYFFPVSAGSQGTHELIVDATKKYKIQVEFAEVAKAAIVPWNFWFYRFNSNGLLLNEIVPSLTKYDNRFPLPLPPSQLSAVIGETTLHSASVRDGGDNSGEDWAGHCHGAAAASVLFRDPQIAPGEGPTFSDEDLKALLTELLYSYASSSNPNMKKYKIPDYGAYPLPPNYPADAPKEIYWYYPNLEDAAAAHGPVASFFCQRSRVPDHVVGVFHATLQTAISDGRRPIIADLRSQQGGSNSVSNHAIYKYVPEYYDLESAGISGTYSVKTLLFANSDVAPPGDNGDPDTATARIQEAEYRLRFRTDGEVDAWNGVHNVWWSNRRATLDASQAHCRQLNSKRT